MSKARPVKRIFIIPHQPAKGLRVRSVELAKQLAHDFGPNTEIIILHWLASKPARLPGPFKMLEKGIEALNSINTKTQYKKESITDPITEKTITLTWATLPYLLSPYPMCQTFNQAQLSHLIDAMNPDVVINANAYHWPLSKQSTEGRLYIYDAVDDHITENSGPVWQRTKKFTIEQSNHADHIITISHSLKALLEQQGLSPVSVVPNVVDIKRYEVKDSAVLEKNLSTLRQKHGIGPKTKTLAYIGNHGWWAGMGFMMDVFETFNAKHSDSKLLIVGPGEDVPHFKAKYKDNPAIVFTGSIPPEDVHWYFHLSEVGLLPFDLCPFTHHALPLKVLEYGAAKKIVLSSELKELELLNLPHIQRLPLDPDTWVNALEKETEEATQTVWQDDWMATIKRYDWQQAIAPLTNIITAGHTNE